MTIHIQTPEWRDGLPWCSTACPAFIRPPMLSICTAGISMTGHGTCQVTDRECDVAQLCAPGVKAALLASEMAGFDLATKQAIKNCKAVEAGYLKSFYVCKNIMYEANADGAAACAARLEHDPCK